MVGSAVQLGSHLISAQIPMLTRNGSSMHVWVTPAEIVLMFLAAKDIGERAPNVGCVTVVDTPVPEKALHVMFLAFWYFGRQSSPEVK